MPPPSPFALFFTKAAFLTFGGAYALLVWLAQAAVEQILESLAWLGLSPDEPPVPAMPSRRPHWARQSKALVQRDLACATACSLGSTAR